ncbi:glycosyl transferase family 2 [Mucilaginibacter gracilis]|uniref:Glycosyl transferase family 2 n=1 Tax=Mucilaginibacter gracilis TaxID=423350 RepID=A0A495J9H8_9SPHI|nr:glycosyltransferase family 2 protein [Mucilaginibacter gracilis]RKR85670.1 glycosyl transferase family 2 [Mucilaginibacter gracilis]
MSDKQSAEVNDNPTTHLNLPDKVSVVIVTFNAAKTLQACLNSIYKQNYSNIEIVIIDGKSTDDTVKIIEANSNKIGFWISEPDSGIYDAMNKALNHITGKWVYFLGADDTLLDDFSALCYELKVPGAFYYGSVLSRGMKCSGLVSEYYQAKIGIYHQAIIYSAEIFKKYKFDTRYRVSADYALNMQCWKDKTIPFVFKDYIIADFNHTGVSSSGPDDVFFADKSSLIRKNFGNRIWMRYMFRRMKEKLRGEK